MIDPTFRIGVVTALALLAAGCAARPQDEARRSIASGEAVRKIQAHFDRDGGRQCAPVLTGASPFVLEARHGQLRSVRALVEAGLLIAEPADPRAGEDQPLRLSPSPAARPFFRQGRDGSAETELCYARRQVTRAWLVGGEGATLNFAYRLVDAPAWTQDPKIQAAFPFLAPALSQELTATGLAPWRDGRWFLDLADDQAAIPGHTEGFWACPDGGGAPDPACGADPR